MIVQLAGCFIMVIIGVSLIGPITKAVNQAISSPEFQESGYSQTAFKTIPGFFALAVLLMAISTAYAGLRSSGFVGDHEEYREEYQKSEHKQTYEEYVRERLRVEKMLKYGWIGRFI